VGARGLQEGVVDRGGGGGWGRRVGARGLQGMLVGRGGGGGWGGGAGTGGVPEGRDGGSRADAGSIRGTTPPSSPIPAPPAALNPGGRPPSWDAPPRWHGNS